MLPIEVVSQGFIVTHATQATIDPASIENVILAHLDVTEPGRVVGHTDVEGKPLLFITSDEYDILSAQDTDVMFPSLKGYKYFASSAGKRIGLVFVKE